MLVIDFIKYFISLLLAFTLSAGCSGKMNRAFYEGIKTQNEAKKTPAEHAMAPTPSFDNYRKERESLKRNESASE